MAALPLLHETHVLDAAAIGQLDIQRRVPSDLGLPESDPEKIVSKGPHIPA